MSSVLERTMTTCSTSVDHHHVRLRNERGIRRALLWLSSARTQSRKSIHSPDESRADSSCFLDDQKTHILLGLEITGECVFLARGPYAILMRVFYSHMRFRSCSSQHKILAMPEFSSFAWQLTKNEKMVCQTRGVSPMSQCANRWRCCHELVEKSGI